LLSAPDYLAQARLLFKRLFYVSRVLGDFSPVVGHRCYRKFPPDFKGAVGVLTRILSYVKHLSRDSADMAMKRFDSAVLPAAHNPRTPPSAKPPSPHEGPSRLKRPLLASAPNVRKLFSLLSRGAGSPLRFPAVWPPFSLCITDRGSLKPLFPNASAVRSFGCSICWFPLYFPLRN